MRTLGRIIDAILVVGVGLIALFTVVVTLRMVLPMPTDAPSAGYAIGSLLPPVGSVAFFLYLLRAFLRGEA
jgi:hypothetical protein